METLDLAANVHEKLDLEFADGLKMIARYVDGGMTTTIASGAIHGRVGGGDGDGVAMPGGRSYATTRRSIENLMRLLDGVSSSASGTAGGSGTMERAKFDATMNEAMRILSAGLPPEPNPKNPVAGSLDAGSPLRCVRQFVEIPEEDDDDGGDDDDRTTMCDDVEVDEQIRRLNDVVSEAFSSSVQIYRVLLLRATAQTLLDNWDTLTTVTSGDIDRAAVSKGALSSNRTEVNAANVQKLFAAYANGSCRDWVQSWWNLIDHDGDGLIDEEEMTSCVNMAMKPVHVAMIDVVHLGLEACPLRTFGTSDENPWFLGGEDVSDIAGEAGDADLPVDDPKSKRSLSWRDRRRELKARRAFANTFRATLKRHFRDQVESPHRLRCIYAWADKSHQNNKLDSIVVDSSDDWGAASSIVGRKRYVELLPKISYAEFREEQARHFPHLDKIGEEIAMSFKEDLWVLQGKRRQNKELRRDSFLFLFGISLADAGIGML
jgi:hypothetical protein